MLAASAEPSTVRLNFAAVALGNLPGAGGSTHGCVGAMASNASGSGQDHTQYGFG